MSQKPKLIIFFLILVSIICYFLFFLNKDNREAALAQWRVQSDLAGRLAISYPKPGTIFPPEIVAPAIRWDDENSNVNSWAVVLNSGEKGKLPTTFVSENHWQPDSALWEQMKQGSLQAPVKIVVLGFQKNEIVSGGETSIQTSADSVNAAVFFRSVPLPFSYALKNLEEIQWHLGDIASSQKPTTLLKNLPFCGNCHSFSQDGKTLAMDVDYANDKGSYAITQVEKETRLSPDEIITWSDFRPEDGKQTFGLLSQISPDGRYAVSTVKDRSIFVAKPDLAYSQLFFPIKGILTVYDRQTNKYFSLPGADDPKYVQSSPTWSPDGKFIYFARTDAFHLPEAENSKSAVLPISVASIFIEDGKEFKYDIYRVPFNDGRGGIAELVAGAGQNGRSNYFPRISPDGKWLVFCCADNFMLLQPDAELYIIPAEGGTPRKMNCNTASMNSWHSWSPNGKWLIFSSKLRGAYTDFWLTHIDENGQDSPPVLLENLSSPKRAGNIPEFVNLKPGELTKIVDDFSNQSHYFYTVGRYKVTDGEFNKALEAFNKALELNPKNPDALAYKGHSEFSLGNYSQAQTTYEKILELDPQNTDALMNLGAVQFRLNKFREAISFYDKVIRFDSKNGAAYFSRGSAKTRLDDYPGSITDFNLAIQNGCTKEDVFYERAISFALLKQFSKAITDLNRVIEMNPRNTMAFMKIGDCFYQMKKFVDASEAYTKALQIESNLREAWSSRGSCKAALADNEGAIDDFSQAIVLAPNSGLDFCKRGLVNIRLGKKDAGCEDLVKAAQLGNTRAVKEVRKNCR